MIARPSDKVKHQAAKQRAAEASEKRKLTVKVPEATSRALKVRAAELGISVAAYFVTLARRDGVDVPELVDGGR